VLVSQRVHGRVEDHVVAEPVEPLTLKGFQSPVSAFRIVAMKAAEEVAR
jgi:class 3 adenylate cyclase